MHMIIAVALATALMDSNARRCSGVVGHFCLASGTNYECPQHSDGDTSARKPQDGRIFTARVNPLPVQFGKENKYDKEVNDFLEFTLLQLWS